MAGMAETLEDIITDAEKTFMLGTKIYGICREIRNKLTEDQLEFDMYADDPSGITGIIGSTSGQLGGNLARQYNGPYVITDIIATWATSSENSFVQASTANSGNATAPGADGTIVTLPSLNPGTYDIQWIVGLQGAAAVADSNNFSLELDSGPSNIVPASVNPGAAGTYPQGTVRVSILAASTISIEAIGAGTAGVVYSGTIIATLVPGPLSVFPTTVTLKLADRTFQLVPETGLFSLSDVKIKMQRDDQIVLQVVPAEPCHLEVIGYAEKRRTDHA